MSIVAPAMAMFAINASNESQREAEEASALARLNSGCKVSVKVTYGAYQCMTKDEYVDYCAKGGFYCVDSARNLQAQQVANVMSSSSDMLTSIIGTPAIFVALIIVPLCLIVWRFIKDLVFSDDTKN